MMGRQLLMTFRISLFLIIHDEYRVGLDLWKRTTPGESKILMKGRIILYVLSSSLCTGRIRWTWSLLKIRSWSWDLFSACVLKLILVLFPAVSLAQHLFKATSKTSWNIPCTSFALSLEFVVNGGTWGTGVLRSTVVLLISGTGGYCSSIRSTKMIESCEKMEQAIVVRNNKTNESIFLSKSKTGWKY